MRINLGKNMNLVDETCCLELYTKDDFFVLIDHYVNQLSAKKVISDDDSSKTYAELKREFLSLAFLLRSKLQNKSAKQPVIGVHLGRSADLLTVFLAIFKLGAILVCLPKSYPQQRVEYIIHDSEMDIIITDDPGFVDKYLNSECQVCLLNDILGNQIANNQLIDSAAKTASTALAYISYTSGSTGTPKGVLVSWANLSNLLNAMRTELEVSADDCFIALTSIGFDIVFLEFLLPVICGAQLFVAPVLSMLRPIELIKILEKNNITILQATPSVLKLIMNALWQPNRPIKVISGGELLDEKLANGLLSLEMVTLYNAYGPTETTIWSSIGKINSCDDINVGKPILNTDFFILDESMQQLPPGSMGELYIAGNGVSCGYQNQVKATKVSFISIAELEQKHLATKYSVLYRSGDLAIKDLNGKYYVYGRKDRQVKVNGNRVELAEIEQCLHKIDGIDKAIVKQEHVETGNALVSYIKYKNEDLHNTKQLLLEVRVHLEKMLPKYMHPDYYVYLQEVPLTLNGKIDYNKLELPTELKNTSAACVLHNKQELSLVALLERLFCEVLHLDVVDHQSSFFQLGGTSYKAIIFAEKLAQHHYDLSLQILYKHSSIRALAEFFSSCQQNNIHPSHSYLSKYRKRFLGSKLNPEAIYPLLPMQKSLLRHFQCFPDSVEYRLQYCWELSGNIDAIKIKKIAERALQFFPTLRSIFLSVSSEYVRYIPREFDLKWHYEIYDFGSSIFNIINNIIKKPLFNLGESLIRFDFIQIGKACYFVITAHHLLFDGWSLKNILHFFNGEGLYPLASKVIDASYDYYIDTLYSGQQESILQFWRNYLIDVKPTRLIDSLASCQYQAIDGDLEKYSERKILLTKQECQLIYQAATINDLSIVCFFQLAWALILSIFTSEADVIFGLVISGRNYPVKNIDKICGLLINCLPLRIRWSSNTRIKESLGNISNDLVNIMQHSNIELNDIMTNGDLFDSIFVVNDFVSTKEMDELFAGDISTKLISNYDYTSFPIKIDLNLHDLYNLKITVDKTLVSDGALNKIVEKYQKVICWLPQHLNMPFSKRLFIDVYEYCILGPRRNIQYTHFYQVFMNSVTRYRSRKAVQYHNSSLTYDEVVSEVNRISCNLISRGVIFGQQVVVFMDRSDHYFLLLVSLLNLSCVYIPIFPDLKLREKYVKMLSQLSDPIIVYSDRYFNYIKESFSAYSVVAFSDLQQANVITALSSSTLAANLAYILFTSGTTGTPKGAMISHGNMMNHLYGKVYDLQLTQHDVVAQTASQTFDISIWQFLVPFVVGAQLVVIDHDIYINPQKLLDTLYTSRITILEIVPSLFASLLDEISKENLYKLKSLRYIMITGEALPVTYCARWFEKIGDIPIVNAYGPTECADDVAHYILTADIFNKAWQNVPIGYPIINTNLYVLDQAMQPVPQGVKGELYIGGAGVGLGYLNDQIKTDRAFVPTPYQASLLYKTGDVVCLSDDNSIVFFGRKDEQIKIDGKRVELGEVESAILKLEYISKVAVLLVNDKGIKNIVAFVVGDFQEVSLNIIQEDLSKYLTFRLIPTYFIVLDKLPMTNNGKVDKKLLSNINYKKNSLLYSSEIKVEKKYLQQLITIWQQYFPNTTIDETSNFFALGGDSILAVQLVSDINETFDTSFQASWILQYPTIIIAAKQIGQFYEGKYSPLVVINKEVQQYPIVFVHPSMAGSEVFGVAVKLLDDKMPIYLLDSYNLYSEPKITSIKGLALFYLELLFKESISFPIKIVGWSLGGVIAYEMASILAKKFDQYPALYLLDSPCFSIKEKRIDQIYENEYLRFIADKRLAEKDDWNKQSLISLGRMEAEMIRQYSPQPYSGKVYFIKAMKKWYEVDRNMFSGAYLEHLEQIHAKKANGWSDFTKVSEVVQVDSDHFGLLQGKNIKAIVDYILANEVIEVCDAC